MTKRPKAYILCILLLLGFVSGRTAQGALQFDPFIGYDGKIHEAGWFPVSFEIFNDGPGFNAIIEISSGQFGSNQKRHVPIELPTNTRKRLVVPMFASGGRFSTQWDVRLLRADGKLVEERLNLPTQIVGWESHLMGALPRNFGGTPIYPPVKNSNQMAAQPEVARLLPEQFPDNPIALEGLDTIYMNSARAIELRLDQVTALLGWVRSGGHLIVAVENPGDVNGTPWLKNFLPVEISASANLPIHTAVMTWLRSEENGKTSAVTSPRGNRPNAPSAYREGEIPPLGDAEMPVATGELIDGQVLLAASDTPLVIQAPRGRGAFTVLTFSPEIEPFRSWEGRNYFWARISGIPGSVFNSPGQPGYGGWSSDGILGALIDSRQIKKLPVGWLLLLLLVYLVVIGPFDQWWLKKINRQMLTWITFPSYVVLFSLLIYFIGYKLRAGETEWNELHIVDVLPRGEKVDLRGRTFISVYSSSNARYPLEGQDGFATLRPELVDLYGTGNNSSRSTVVQNGNSFEAEVFVPVWTSLLFVNDWFQTNDTPFRASITTEGSNHQADLHNLLNRPLEEVRIAVGDRIYEVGTLAPNERKTFTLSAEDGTSLQTFVQQYGGHFQQAVTFRRSPVGTSQGGQLEDRALTATVVSFLSYLDQYNAGTRSFVSPSGLDMAAAVQRGDAVVFASAPQFTFTERINQFQPPRFRQDTFLRLTIPVRSPSI